MPHAGLGYHFLRVQVRATDPGGLQKEKWPKAEEANRRSRVEQDDGGPCTSAKLTSTLLHFSAKIKSQQVHRADQALLPRCKVALLGAVPCICCAPLLNTNHFTIQKKPCDYKGHTHTEPACSQKDVTKRRKLSGISVECSFVIRGNPQYATTILLHSGSPKFIKSHFGQARASNGGSREPTYTTATIP